MAQFKRLKKLYSPVNPTPAKNMRHAYRGRLKKQKEKSQQRMSKDDHYSVSATNRKSRIQVIADNVQKVLSENDEEILKAAYSKKKKTNKTPSHSNTTKTSTATSSEEAAQTTTTRSTKTTTSKTSEAAGTTTVKTKQKQSKLTSFFKL